MTPPYRYLGQCDRLRLSSPHAEATWQAMIAGRKPISRAAFLAKADLGPLLDEDETKAQWLSAQPGARFFASSWDGDKAVYIETAGFEFIFVEPSPARLDNPAAPAPRRTADAMRAVLRGAGLPVIGSLEALERRLGRLEAMRARWGSLSQPEIAARLSVAQLKAELRSVGAPATGTKNRLAARLLHLAQPRAPRAPTKRAPTRYATIVWTNPLTGQDESLGQVRAQDAEARAASMGEEIDRNVDLLRQQRAARGMSLHAPNVRVRDEPHGLPQADEDLLHRLHAVGLADDAFLGPALGCDRAGLDRAHQGMRGATEAIVRAPNPARKPAPDVLARLAAVETEYAANKAEDAGLKARYGIEHRTGEHPDVRRERVAALDAAGKLDGYWERSNDLQHRQEHLFHERWELRTKAGFDPRTGQPPVRERASRVDLAEEGHYPDLLGETTDVRGGCRDNVSVHRDSGTIVHTSCFNGTFHHLRYRDARGRVVAGLTLHAKRPVRGKQTATIDRVYTDASHRRRGYAAALLTEARRYFNKVKHSSDLTGHGKAWKRAVNPVDPQAFADYEEGDTDWSPQKMRSALNRAERRFGVKLAGPLYGCGNTGCAAPLKDGRVLKVTIDEKEVEWARVAKKHAIAGVVTIHTEPVVVGIDDWSEGEGADEPGPSVALKIYAYVRDAAADLPGKLAATLAAQATRAAWSTRKAPPATPTFRPIHDAASAYARLGYMLFDWQKTENLGITPRGAVVLRDARVVRLEGR
jgi:predicted GNAT family acetyltransferase